MLCFGVMVPTAQNIGLSNHKLKSALKMHRLITTHVRSTQTGTHHALKIPLKFIQNSPVILPRDATNRQCNNKRIS